MTSDKKKKRRVSEFDMSPEILNELKNAILKNRRSPLNTPLIVKALMLVEPTDVSAAARVRAQPVQNNKENIIDSSSHRRSKLKISKLDVKPVEEHSRKKRKIIKDGTVRSIINIKE